MINKVKIISEAGVNHNGSIDIAKKLIDCAAHAGSDYIKFQTFITELNISKNAKMADYQISNTNDKFSSQFKMVKELELSFDDYYELNDYCNKKDIKFLSTGFDIPSIDFLDELNIDFFKIPSGEITNEDLIKHIGSKKKSVIMSTGMSNIKEIQYAFNLLLNSGLNLNQIKILHCNTEYPTPYRDVNLLAMNHIKSLFGVDVGYSDHTLGIEVPIAAVSLGAVFIEKHFTLDKNMSGPDHKASLEPSELKKMIKSIRNIEQSISGSGIKEVSQSEKKNLTIARKSLHINTSLKSGTLLKKDHLIALRPGDGISPIEISKVIGKKINKDMKRNTKIFYKDLI